MIREVTELTRGNMGKGGGWMEEVIQFQDSAVSLKFLCIPDDRQHTLIVLIGEHILSLDATEAQRLLQWLSHYRGTFTELTLQMLMQD